MDNFEVEHKDVFMKIIKKGHNEEVSSFNNRFIKLFNKIPPHLKPMDHMCLVF